MSHVRFPSLHDLFYPFQPASLRWWLAGIGMLTLVYFLTSFDRIQQFTQTNTLELTADFLAIVVAAILFMLLIATACMSGHLFSWLTETVIVAAFRAMVLETSVVFLTLPVQVIGWMGRSLGRLSRQLFGLVWGRLPSRSTRLVWTASPGKLPYRLYPLSCILLN